MEQRLNFSDYPEAEQIRDVEKAERRHYHDIYVMRVNGDWGAVFPRKRYNVIFNADTGVELIDFIQDLKKELNLLGIKTRFHCVNNFGIESKIAEHQHFIGAKNNGRD